MSRTLLHVNGGAETVDVLPDTPLLYVLRDHLGLTGAKYGCGEGQCGACTVLLDDRPVRSCVTPVRLAVGRPITTIEGLEQGGRLHPVQEAFLKTEAFQCGYCTPGMILAGVALLRQNPHAGDEEIRSAIGGHICRCGTYSRIVDALRTAARPTS